MSTETKPSATPPGLLRRNAVRLTALALIATFYGFARLPTLTQPEREALASRFVERQA